VVCESSFAIGIWRALEAINGKRLMELGSKVCMLLMALSLLRITLS